jgi:hypothetical protein
MLASCVYADANENIKVQKRSGAMAVVLTES